MDDISAGLANSVWAFGSGKGGVGKTFLTSNIGILLAQEGYNVVLFDGDMVGPNLHTALGVGRPQKALSDFILGKVDSLEELLVPTKYKNLSLIPGAENALNADNPNYTFKKKLKKKLHALKHDFIIMDNGSGAGFGVTDLMTIGDTGILVTSPDPSSVELVYRSLKVIIYRRMRSLAGHPDFENCVDEVMVENPSVNMLELIDQVLTRIERKDRKVAEKIEKHLYSANLKLIVNMSRNIHDQSLGPSICEIAKKHYGMALQFLGYIPHDDRVVQTGKHCQQFVVEQNGSDTAACLNLIKKALVDSNSKRELSLPGQLSLIRT